MDRMGNRMKWKYFLFSIAVVRFTTKSHNWVDYYDAKNWLWMNLRTTCQLKPVTLRKNIRLRPQISGTTSITKTTTRSVQQKSNNTFIEVKSPWMENPFKVDCRIPGLTSSHLVWGMSPRRMRDVSELFPIIWPFPIQICIANEI